MTTVAELARLSENKLYDSGKNASQAFWCEEKDIEKMELLQGDHVRLKTKGEGPFIGENRDIVLLILFLGSFSAEMSIFFTSLLYLHLLVWKQLYLLSLAVSTEKKVQ